MFSMQNAQSLLGLLVMVVFCWLISENRRAFPWRLGLSCFKPDLCFSSLPSPTANPS